MMTLMMILSLVCSGDDVMTSEAGAAGLPNGARGVGANNATRMFLNRAVELETAFREISFVEDGNGILT